ncbi:DUF1207 domain-containing protein [Candidatus Palauibacter sp.]|uniref:DUF1207 domain-containing protein n=1 Tax=Candidatus Palauibacter sp. TaxID=3101350 RepID=UPI003B023F61
MSAGGLTVRTQRQDEPASRASPAGGRRRALVAGVLTLLAAALSQPLSGQVAGDPGRRIRDPDGHPFRTPAGSPLEPAHRLGFFRADRDSLRDGIASADLGDRLTFWISRDPDGPVEYAGSIQGGAFSRFDLTGPDQTLIEVHYRIGVLFRARLGALAARAEFYHVSSHLGDEFLLDTGALPISTSREGIEVLVQGSPFSGLTVYGGPGVLLRTSRDFDAVSFRAGADWESSSVARARLYASADLFAWAELGWEPALAGEVGAAIGRGARLGLVLGLGPSRAEQFFRQSERLFGLSISYVR